MRLIVLNLFASKLFPLWSQTKYRQKADSIGFTQVADDLATQHAKKSQELQSDVSLSTLIIRVSPRGESSHTTDCHFQLAYKANIEQTLHQYTMTKDEPLFRQAKANADLLSAVSSGKRIPVGIIIPLTPRSLSTCKSVEVVNLL